MGKPKPPSDEGDGGDNQDDDEEQDDDEDQPKKTKDVRAEHGNAKKDQVEKKKEDKGKRADKKTVNDVDQGSPDSDAGSLASDSELEPNATKKAKATSPAPPSEKPGKTASKASVKTPKVAMATAPRGGSEQDVQDAEDGPVDDAKLPSAKREVGGRLGAMDERRKKGALPEKKKASGNTPEAAELADIDESDAGSGRDGVAAPSLGNSTCTQNAYPSAVMLNIPPVVADRNTKARSRTIYR
jgi:hypothetical protein